MSSVSPCIQRQSRVARRIHEQMDSAEAQEQSQNSPDLSESTVSVKAKRRQGVSDLRIPPLALFSLGTLGSADPDWQFTHCASDSESGDGEDQVFDFPRPPKSGLEASAFFSRYSHSPHSSVDSTSTSSTSHSHIHSECSSPTSSGPPATPTSPMIRPLSIRKRNTAGLSPLPSPARFTSSGPSLPRSATSSSSPRSSSLPPRSSSPPSPPSSPSTPSPSPRHIVKSEEQAAAADEFYAVQARGFVTLARSARKPGVVPILPSTSTFTAQNVPPRPKRAPPPPPSPLDATPCSFSPSLSAPSASAPQSPHLRNSHVHTNSASYPRARMATSDAHARPRSSSTSTSSSYSTSSITGQAAPSSVWFPSSYTPPALGAASSSRSRSPSTSRPRTGLVPNFSRPTSLALGLLIPPSAAAAVPVSHQSACLAPRELERDYTAEYDPVSGYTSGLDARRRSGERDGEEDCAGAGGDGQVDLADFDFAADYAAYAPLLRTPTPSPGVGMGYGISIGATAPWGAHVHGDDEDGWVAYTEEAGYIEDGGDEEQQRELSPLVAPAPSPAPLSESESEYSPDEDDDNEDKQEHGGDWGPLASVPRFSCTSSSCSSSYGDPLLAPPPPQPLRTPAESAHPTPALCSRWSSSTLSSLHSTHGRARASKTFSFGRYLPRARPTTKPKPKSSVARPAPRPMGSVTVLPPSPWRLRAPDYAESSRLSSGSVSAGWSYAAAIAQRSAASSPPSAAGHHSAQSSVSGHSARGSLSVR
ncbi:hypothetical protein B0H14DRAFT_3874628 [Mycena olivaceomarginata]|nr:hypothetical protein B0H14DRAFT_3874628 [Mycena olivaceomarginata]